MHERLKGTGCHIARVLVLHFGKHIADEPWGTEGVQLFWPQTIGDVKPMIPARAHTHRGPSKVLIRAILDGQLR